MTSSRRPRPPAASDQPALFAVANAAVPARFRLDEATRRRGMRHIAEIRAHLEARYPSDHTPAGGPARPGGTTRPKGRAA